MSAATPILITWAVGFFRRRHAYEVSIQSMQWKLSPDDLDKGTAAVPLEVAGNQVR